MNHDVLKLMAQDLEDLQLIASHLQDALAPLTAMTYNQQKKTFHLLINRFCWEHPEEEQEGKKVYHRVHSGLTFYEVEKAYHRGFVRHGDERALNLLTLHTKIVEDGHEVHLLCSDHKEIFLKTRVLKCALCDIDEPWPTHTKPTHLHEYLKNLTSFSKN
jgi:hypothetical protein